MKDALETTGKLRADVRFEEIQAEAQTELASAKKQLADGYQELTDGQKKLDDARAELDAGWKEYNSSKVDFDSQIADARKALDEGNAQYDQALAAYQTGLREYQDGQAKLGEGAEVLVASKKQLDDAKKQLDEAKKIIDENSAKFEQSRLDGQKKLDDAKAKLLDGEAKLLDGEQKYAEEKTKAGIKLADAQQKIDAGEKQLAELKTPEWYVLDHDTNIGFVGYKQDAQRLDAISLVIPLLFFLVAVLVTMTSMTRLVESDRPYIGTLKALGYGNGRIAMRYLQYAVTASLVGSAIGLLAGFNVFPRVIFNAYANMYTLPPIHIAYSLSYAAMSTAVAVTCAALPAWFVCIQSLRDAPAELMRPPAPQIGKRTLLERVTPIWKRLNFSQKVAMRNLFRYKKRLVMTVIGVAGCTALMFAGFGLRDSITNDLCRNNMASFRNMTCGLISSKMPKQRKWNHLMML